MQLAFNNNTLAVVTTGGTTAPASGSGETWTVTGAQGFPSSLLAGQYFHVADPVLLSEKVKVTAISGSSWTVVRGDESTTPVVHAAGFAIQQVVTGGDFGVLSRPANVFHIDDYGADPTGTNLSDTAWNNCYTAASAAVQAQGGVTIRLGGGNYKFSMGTVAVTDGRIGLQGEGRGATWINTTGNTGTLVTINSSAGGPGHSSAPVGGFTLYGWNAGNSSNGMKYGDRPNGTLYDITATGFGGTTSRGFWFQDNANLSEGSHIWANAEQCTICYDFDKVTQNGSGSFDYSHIMLHVNCTTAGGNSAIACRFLNGQHSYGSNFSMHGNISATTGLTATALQVGNSASDHCYLQSGLVHVSMEADTSAGTCKDVVVNTASGYGILQIVGTLDFFNATGSYSAGSVTGGVLTGAGHFNGPLFTSHGTLTLLGPGANTAGFYTYTG